MRNNRLLIAPVFIPHEGCPYRCVFCNQTDITGYKKQADKENVLSVLKIYLSHNSNSKHFSRREVAFYGGSFTGLSDERQDFLLSLIQPLIRNGKVDAIRVSTHPLFVNERQLNRLKKNGVQTVELGIQSTNHIVLEKSGRPCSKDQIMTATSLVKKLNFKLGLQLMLGLPGDNEKRFITSVRDVIKMNPDFVRLYPSVVLRHTPLYSMYSKGLYFPWSMRRTLDALKNSIKLFRNADISIARVGLQPDSSLSKNFVSGPFHPSLRYLVDCDIGLDLMTEIIDSQSEIPKIITFRVPKNMESIYTGNHRRNLKILKVRFGLDKVCLLPDDLCRHLELVA